MIQMDGTVLCEHEHWDWQPGFASRQIGHHFRTTREVTALEAPVCPSYQGPDLTIEPGTLLRLDAAVVAGDAFSDAFFGKFRCRILTGSRAGACVELPGQPTLSPLDPVAFERGWRGPEGCVQLD